MFFIISPIPDSVSLALMEIEDIFDAQMLLLLLT